MQKRTYTIVLTPEPDGSAINVTSPDVPELVTFGTTRTEAIAMAKDCAEQVILSWLQRGEAAPEPVPASKLATVDVDLDELAERLASQRVAAGT